LLFTSLLSTADMMLLRSVLRTVTYMDRHNRRKTSWAVARGTLGFTNKTDTDTVRFFEVTVVDDRLCRATRRSQERTPRSSCTALPTRAPVCSSESSQERITITATKTIGGESRSKAGQMYWVLRVGGFTLTPVSAVAPSCGARPGPSGSLPVFGPRASREDLGGI
jgi:hypothetical protein